MTDRPLVTIIINNYNYANFLSQAIESALNQHYENIEIIVVDDGSQDNSRSIISSYGDNIHTIFKQNGGQASAFNAGFQASKGEIVCFLDADDTFMPNKVSCIVELFKKYPKAGWVFHELQYVNKDGSEMQIEVQRATDSLQFKDFRTHIKGVNRLPYFPATTGLSFRANLLMNILPIPEVFRISADFFLRLASICQVPGILSPEDLGTHRQHGDNLYVLHPDRHKKSAEIGIYTAWHLYSRFKEFRPFTNRLFSRSVGQLAALKGLRSPFTLTEGQQYMRTFLSEKNIIILINCMLCMLLNFWRTIRSKQVSGIL